MTDISELIRRLKEEGPSRELDAAIHLTTDDELEPCKLPLPESIAPGCVALRSRSSGTYYPYWANAPAYTSSLEAALTLYRVIPERVPSNPIKACLEALNDR